MAKALTTDGAISGSTCRADVSNSVTNGSTRGCDGDDQSIVSTGDGILIGEMTTYLVLHQFTETSGSFASDR
jgi:hypothetical protein